MRSRSNLQYHIEVFIRVLTCKDLFLPSGWVTWWPWNFTAHHHHHLLHTRHPTPSPHISHAPQSFLHLTTTLAIRYAQISKLVLPGTHTEKLKTARNVGRGGRRRCEAPSPGELLSTSQGPSSYNLAHGTEIFYLLTSLILRSLHISR